MDVEWKNPYLLLSTFSALDSKLIILHCPAGNQVDYNVVVKAYSAIDNHFEVESKYQFKKLFQNFAGLDCNFVKFWIMASFFFLLFFASIF